MDSNRYKIAGSTFLAIASLLIGFALPNQAFAQVSENVTGNIVITGGNTMCFSSFPVGASYTEITKNSKYPAGTSVASFTGGPSHTCANGYTYNTSSHLTSDGTYYISNFTTGIGTGDEYYGIVEVLSGQISVVYEGAEYLTRFTNFDVSGTASSTVFDVEYFLELSEINSNNRPDTVSIHIQDESNANVDQFQKLILPLEQGPGTTTVVRNTGTPLPDGNYSAWLNFWNFNQQLFTFSKSNITVNFTISGGIVTSSTIVEQSDATSPFNYESYVDEPCGLTNIGGCVKNAFAGAFYPSPDSINSFTALYDTLSTKFPFAYFTDFNDSIASVFSGATTASLAVTVPFGDYGEIDLLSAEQISAVPLTSTIRNLLGSLIWIMLGLTVYRRTQKIFNHEHTT